ncbi:MAG: hypothetical protein ACRCZP_06520 [Phycicoccus sp.]
MIRRWLARRRLARQWDRAARDVRASLAGAAAEIVDRRTDHGTHPDTARITGQVWGDLTNLMYPDKKEHGT